MHDLGHPPFGHAGEDVLDECLRDDGGFSHNAQALRIVDELETRYPEFPGLEPDRAKCSKARRTRIDARRAAAAPAVGSASRRGGRQHRLRHARRRRRAGTGPADARRLLAMPLWREAARRASRGGSRRWTTGELRRAVVHELIDWQVGDLLDASASATGRSAASTAPPPCAQAPPIVVASRRTGRAKAELEAFLRERVYRHPDVLAHRDDGPGRAARDVRRLRRPSPSCCPSDFRRRADAAGLRRTVGDYLAGMTDRFAVARVRAAFRRLAPRG